MAKTITREEAERMFDSITDEVAKRRTAIAAAVSGANTSEYLGRKVNELAEAEGAFKAIQCMMRCLQYAERTGEAANVREELTELLLAGADDSWSGRGNDVKRAEFDGLRGQTNRLLRSF